MTKLIPHTIKCVCFAYIIYPPNVTKCHHFAPCWATISHCWATRLLWATTGQPPSNQIRYALNTHPVFKSPIWSRPTQPGNTGHLIYRSNVQLGGQISIQRSLICNNQPPPRGQAVVTMVTRGRAFPRGSLSLMLFVVVLTGDHVMLGLLQQRLGYPLKVQQVLTCVKSTPLM